MSLSEKPKKRWSYREFESKPFDIKLLIDAIDDAKYAPNGAINRLGHFFIKDPLIKSQIRTESENVEMKIYQKISVGLLLVCLSQFYWYKTRYINLYTITSSFFIKVLR